MRKLLKRLGYTLLVLFVLLNIMAAFHAYKFTHFYNRDVAVVKSHASPAGFWDKAGAIVFGIKAYKQPLDSIPALLDTLHITTADKITLSAWSDFRGTKGTVLLFHGHGGNKAGVLPEARVFATLGYKILMVDFRAHGNSEGNACTIGYEETKDVKAAYDYVVARGDTNIIFYGISMGAAAAMKAVKEYGLKPARMILEMPFGTLTEAVKGRCRIMGVPAQPTATLLTFWGGVQHGFWAFNYQPQEYAKAIECPVLLQWGAKDVRVGRSETDNIFRNIQAGHKQLMVYPAAGHESLLLHDGTVWTNTVTAFLQR